MDATDETREPTEVGLEVGDVGSTETPGSAVDDGKEDPMSAELDGGVGLALESQGRLEAEASEETAPKDGKSQEDAGDLESNTAPSSAAEGSEVEKVDVPGAPPVSELPERRLRQKWTSKMHI